MVDDTPLAAALALSRAAGYLGAAPVAEHLRHSRAFTALVPQDARVADLGAGGGVPGLVLAADRSDLSLVLVESSRRRADHLVRLVERLGLADRVEVETRPAEAVGRDPARRGSFEVVVARGFGPPAVVAECGAPLLVPGGRLLVAEPPTDDGSRWAPLTLSDLPLALAAVHVEGEAHVAELILQAPCPARYPRRAGIPARSPLF